MKTRRGVYLITSASYDGPEGVNVSLVFGHVGVCEGRPFGIYHDNDEGCEAFKGTDLITGVGLTEMCYSREQVEAQIAERMPVVIEDIASGSCARNPWYGAAIKAVERALDQMAERGIITRPDAAEYLRTGRLPLKASDVRRRSGRAWKHDEYLPTWKHDEYLPLDQAVIRRIAVIPDPATPNLCGARSR